MPDEKPGILVDPMGPAEALSPEEHKLLRRLLTIYRAEDGRGKAFHDHIYHLLYRFERTPETITSKQIMQASVISFLQDHENSEYASDGLLSGFDDNDFFMLEAEDLRTLVNTNKALQIGGWFAEWLSLQVTCIANAERPEERCPSPLLIAGSLTESIIEWNSEQSKARAFAERRPDLLFGPEIYELRHPAPPAEREALEPAGKGPTIASIESSLRNVKQAAADLRRELADAKKAAAAPRARKRHRKAAA